MSGFISFSALDNCYATAWSYGEICVHCNCCGRNGKGLKMWQSRLALHREELNNNLNFDRWDECFRDLQEKNVKANIAYHTKYIKQCERWVRYYTDKAALLMASASG